MSLHSRWHGERRERGIKAHARRSPVVASRGGPVETIKIQHPNAENDFLIINKRDFDPEKHVEWIDPAERKQGDDQNGGQGGEQNAGLSGVPQPAAATAPEVIEEPAQEELPEVPEPKAAKKGKK